MIKKNRHIILYFIVGVAFLLPSCISPYYPEIDNDSTKNILVVEGTITNEKGPFKVRLTESVSVYSDPNILDNEYPVAGANVQIFDDKGNSYRLYEEKDGWYETANKQLQGTIGNTYSLTIITPDGGEYESTPEFMHEVPDIDSIYTQEIQTTVFEGTEAYTENGINILVDCKAPVESEIYLWWQFEETWKFKMPLYVLVNHGPCREDPDCESASMETIDVDYEKITCWNTEPSREILVASTNNYKDKQIKNFKLQSIDSRSDRLNIKYSILVKQYAIERELYSFFKKLREANKETAGLYSTLPGQVFGNINCCNNEKKALGYFIVSAVKTKRIFIDHFNNNVENGNAFTDCGWTTNPPPGQKIYLYGTYKDDDGNIRKVWDIDEYCTDCRIRGTDIKPDFWE